MEIHTKKWTIWFCTFFLLINGANFFTGFSHLSSSRRTENAEVCPLAPNTKSRYRTHCSYHEHTENDVCYELGSGDGRVSVYLAKESEASVIGIEVFPLLHAIAMLRARFWVWNKPRLICSDIFQTDFSDATHIYLFGMPESLQWVLTTHLQNSLRKGTIIISYIYPYPDFSLERVDRGAEGKANPIWIYRV